MKTLDSSAASESERLQPPQQRIVAIINPVSCPVGSDPMRQEIEAALARHGATATFFETCEEETAYPIARQAIQDGATLIIAAGGDGTIMESINAAQKSPVAVGIVPAGTGNLLAANLGIPLTVDAAIDVVMTGETTLIDLVSINNGEKYFAIMGGLGYDADIMLDTPRAVKQRIGKAAYFFTALRDMSGRRFSVHITLDDKRRIRTRAKMLLIANMGEVMKGVKLFPEADPTDAMMEVGILKGTGFTAVMQTVWHTLRGKPSGSRYFDRYTARKIAVRTHHPKPLEVDGDVLGETREFTAQIVPKAASVRVPAGI